MLFCTLRVHAPTSHVPRPHGGRESAFSPPTRPGNEATHPLPLVPVPFVLIQNFKDIAGCAIMKLKVSQHSLWATSSFARFARSATSPRSPTVSNPAPDSSLCRAAAPRLRPLQLLLAACVRFESAVAPGPDCIRFNCCSPFTSASSCCSPIAPASAAAACLPLASASAAVPDHVRFSCCSPIVSASTAAPRLHASACSPSWIPAQCSQTSFAVQ